MRLGPRRAPGMRQRAGEQCASGLGSLGGGGGPAARTTGSPAAVPEASGWTGESLRRARTRAQTLEGGDTCLRCHDGVN